MMDVISLLLNAALVGVTAWLCYVISTSKPDPIFTDALARDTRCFSEILQRLERIENAQQLIIARKAGRVSDDVDALLTGGFEIQRGTPYQKEQRRAGNATEIGIPSMGPEPQFRVGDYVHVKDTPHWFIVGAVIWSEKDGCYTYSDGNSLATIHREFKLEALIPPRFKIGQLVYKTNEADFTFEISAICYSEIYNQFTYQGGADQPYWICEQDLEICGVKP